MAANPDLGSIRSVPPWRQKVSAFWRWWSGELAQLLPDQLALLRGAGSSPMLAVEGDEVVAIDAHGAASRANRGSWRALLERAGETRGRARAMLGRDEALVRRATLPAATEENLAQVLAFEMDRLSPFRADEIYFDHRVLSRDSAAGQIVVELAIARRDLVDKRVAELRALGASVQGVALREDASRASHPFDLLPSEQRGAREAPRERLVRFGLIGIVVLLLVAALVVPLVKKWRAVYELNPVLEKAHAEASATESIVRELEKQAADYNFLLTKKYTNYPSAAYLEEISRLLPDNTWIQQLDLKTSGKTREVQITGETPSSSKLIEIFEQSKVMQNAATKGTITKGAGPGTERFMIVAEARPRQVPEAQPATATATAPVPTPMAPPRPVEPPPAAAPTPPGAEGK
jgi:general secretion pathway protein L